MNLTESGIMLLGVQSCPWLVGFLRGAFLSFCIFVEEVHISCLPLVIFASFSALISNVLNVIKP